MFFAASVTWSQMPTLADQYLSCAFSAISDSDFTCARFSSRRLLSQAENPLEAPVTTTLINATTLAHNVSAMIALPSFKETGVQGFGCRNHPRRQPRPIIPLKKRRIGCAHWRKRPRQAANDAVRHAEGPECIKSC